WEYISPYYGKKKDLNMVYRAYRAPYEWVPQIEKPEEIFIPSIDNSNFRVPGSPRKKVSKVTLIKSKRKFTYDSQLCVLPSEEE
ncbi:thioredoxin, partial [Chloroflexota bacterium]